MNDEQNNYCWPWNDKVNSDGYGIFLTDEGEWHLAHRVAAHLEGIIPKLDDPRTVYQRCQNKLCCNPKHLGAAFDWECWD